MSELEALQKIGLQLTEKDFDAETIEAAEALKLWAKQYLTFVKKVKALTKTPESENNGLGT